MYLRHTQARGKHGERSYWTLVESVRQGTKVRQRVVAHLGRLEPEERARASKLARHFLGPRADQPELFEDTRDLSDAHVRVGKVRLERGVAFGDVWMGWTLWRALALDEFCRSQLPVGRESAN